MDESQVDPRDWPRRSQWDNEDRPKKEDFKGIDRFMFRDDFYTIKIKTCIDPKFKFVEVPEFLTGQLTEDLDSFE